MRIPMHPTVHDMFSTGRHYIEKHAITRDFELLMEAGTTPVVQERGPWPDAERRQRFALYYYENGDYELIAQYFIADNSIVARVRLK